MATPPLYKVKIGKEVSFVYSDNERDELIKGYDLDEEEDNIDIADKVNEEEDEKEDDVKKNTKESKSKPRVSVQRYKGLGEMNADELWETTMDPERRILKQVTIESAQEADKTFDMLMGSEVAPRKAFIQKNAAMANLDV